MNFSLTKNPELFRRALFLPSLKEETNNYSKLHSYLYIISKTFNSHEDTEPKHLVKVGYSSIDTLSGSRKGLTRLLGFRTSLISFKIHRLYMYGENQQASKTNKTNSELAHNAEIKLHKLILDLFKPKTKRIKFDENEPEVSEWFDIPKKDMPKFLSFCDEAIYNLIAPNVLGASAFTKNTWREIKKKRDQKFIGIERNEQKASQKENARPIKSKEFTRSLKQAQEEIDAKNRELKKRKEDEENRKELRKTVLFWKKLFVGLNFYDKEMYKGDTGKFPRKVITNVYQHNGVSGVMKPQIMVEYEPDIRKTRSKKISEKDLEEGSGIITINETLLYFNKLREKYKKSYDYYRRYNRYDEAVNYPELD